MKPITVKEFLQFIKEKKISEETELYVEFRKDKPVYDVGICKVYTNNHKLTKKYIVLDCRKNAGIKK